MLSDTEDASPISRLPGQSTLDSIQPKTGSLPARSARILKKPSFRYDMTEKRIQDAELSRINSENSAREEAIRKEQGGVIGTRSYRDDHGILHAGDNPNKGPNIAEADKDNGHRLEAFHARQMQPGPNESIQGSPVMAVNPTPASTASNQPANPPAPAPTAKDTGVATGPSAITPTPAPAAVSDSLDPAALKAPATPGFSWDAKNPQNIARQQKIAAAVQWVKDSKIANGTDPESNEYKGFVSLEDGKGTMASAADPRNPRVTSQDITSNTISSLNQSAKTSRDIADDKNKSILESVKNGDMSKADAMVPAANAANSSAQAYADTSNRTNSVTMTPYGVVATSRGNLGSAGFDKILASQAVQDAAKQQRTPAALAAVNPTPMPRKLNQGAYNPPPSRLAMAN